MATHVETWHRGQLLHILRCSDVVGSPSEVVPPLVTALRHWRASTRLGDLHAFMRLVEWRWREFSALLLAGAALMSAVTTPEQRRHVSDAFCAWKAFRQCAAALEHSGVRAKANVAAAFGFWSERTRKCARVLEAAEQWRRGLCKWALCDRWRHRCETDARATKERVAHVGAHLDTGAQLDVESRRKTWAPAKRSTAAAPAIRRVQRIGPMVSAQCLDHIEEGRGNTGLREHGFDVQLALQAR